MIVKMCINIEDKVKKQVRIAAAKADTCMSDWVAQLIIEALKDLKDNKK